MHAMPGIVQSGNAADIAFRLPDMQAIVPGRVVVIIRLHLGMRKRRAS